MSSINDKFNEVYAEYDPLVWNILTKYIGNGVLPRDIDDLHQDIWMTIWDKAVKEGEFSDSLKWQIAGITRNIIKDFKRRDQRANQITPKGYQTRVDYYGSEDDSDEVKGASGVYNATSDFYGQEFEVDAPGIEAVYALRDSYPEGSKERIYIDWYLDKSDKEQGERSKFTDSELAQKVGYSGTSSGGWKSFKTRMQDEIMKALDKEPPKAKEYAPRGRTVNTGSK